MNLRSERATLLAFLVGSLLAGGNAVGVRFSNRELEPLWGAGVRFAAASIVLIVIVAVLRLPMPRGRALVGAVLFGLLNFAAAFALTYYALQELEAGFGQIVLALVPLATLLLAVLERRESFRWAAALGGAIALVGIFIMSQGALGDSTPVLSLLAMLGAALCFAQAAIVIGWFPGGHPITLNAVAMAVGAVVLLAGSLLAGEEWAFPMLAATWTSVAYLVFVGSVVVFVLYVLIIENWGASRAAYTLVLIPPVTIVVSWWLLDEPVGWGLLFGGALVLLGVYVGALRRSRV